MKTKLVLATAAGVRGARNVGIVTEDTRRAPEILARAEKELARVRRAAETCAAYAAHSWSERHEEGARLLWSRVAALKAAIAELRREMELSGLLEQGGEAH